MKPTNVLWLVLAFLAVWTGLLFGQGGTNGTIVGLVTDSTGAVVPGAGITIKNRDTNLTQTDLTNSAGEYSFP
jgi:hypothetical protein